MPGNFSCYYFLLSSDYFLKINISEKFFQEILSVKQFKSRSGLTFHLACDRFQTVCKGYQQVTPSGKVLKNELTQCDTSQYLMGRPK